MERWLTSSFEYRESALITRGYGVPGFFILLFTEIDVPINLRWVSQGLWIVVKDVKTLVVYNVE